MNMEPGSSSKSAETPAGWRRARMLCAFAGLALAAAAHAVTIPAQVGEIMGVWIYTEYGGGDVVVEVQTPPSGCANGYWLRMSDPGAKATYAALLAAYHAKTHMRIDGHGDQLWAGSSGQYCRIYAVGPGL